MLVVTLLHNTVGSALCRKSWSLLCCLILQAAFYVDILVITLLHNIVGSLLCRYLCHYFVAQYFRQRTIQISWSLLCYIILQAAYYVHILVVTLLNNSVGSVLCRYLNHYFAVQNCLQCTMLISWSLLCYTILQAAYYLYILVVTLLHNTVAAYYVDILVITLLHNIVGSVLCRYHGRYFTAPYCRQSTMQISQSLLCCTILQAAYYVDIGHYFAAQYCRQRSMQISWSLLCCTYCSQRSIQISWSLFFSTILQAAYYEDILFINMLHNTVGSVLCRYLGRYFAAQYCRQRTMQISCSFLYCTILQAAYYVYNLVVTLLHNTVVSVLCRYLGSSVLCCYLSRYFAAQYCRQHTMQISWSLLCCTICRQRTMQISWSLLWLKNLVGSVYVDILFITLLHNIVCCVLCRYLGRYFAALYCRLRTLQISWCLIC